MTRRPIDPHLDPLRAPSRRGQHPHVGHDDRNENPQQMYEMRTPVAPGRPHPDATTLYRQLPPLPPRPVGAVPPPPPSALDNPLVILGLGALAAYAIYRMTEEKPRQNPAPAAPANPGVVVVSPAGVPVQSLTVETPAQAAPAAPVKALPAPAPVTVEVTAPTATATATPEAPKKKSHITEKGLKKLKKSAKQQNRDPETGVFLPGKKGKKK
jgi:hypothetical protein